MKIYGTETRRYINTIFSLHVVDSLDFVYTANFKSGFWKNSDCYKKNIYTNGIIQKITIEKNNDIGRMKFKVTDGDWLVIIEDQNNITMYISDQYYGPIKVKNKSVQTIIDACYDTCRKRIRSKREFAKEIGDVSRQLNLPFQIVLAFKGNTEMLKQMVANIQNAINKELYNNADFMHMLMSEDVVQRENAIHTFGIYEFPTYQSEKIAGYLNECLLNKKIVRRYE